MGGGYSASGSQSISNSSGVKLSTGPTTFGGVAFGSSGGSGMSLTTWLLIGAAGVAAFFFFRK